jgi:hypothetical protein
MIGFRDGAIIRGMADLALCGRSHILRRIISLMAHEALEVRMRASQGKTKGLMSGSHLRFVIPCGWLMAALAVQAKGCLMHVGVTRHTVGRDLSEFHIGMALATA